MRHRTHYTLSHKPIHGFTLVELLVVIAIIALLLSILMPSLSKVREQARTIVCRADLKQWGIWFAAFSGDNNVKCPPADSPFTVADRTAWFAALAPYYGADGAQKMLLCPSAQPRNPGSGAKFRGKVNDAYWIGWWSSGKTLYHNDDPARPTANVRPVYASYGFNLWFGNTDRDVQGRKKEYFWQNFIAAGNKSAEVPLMLDSFWRGGGPYWLVPGRGHAASKPTAKREYSDEDEINEMATFHVDRHDQGVNSVFLDGHASKVYLKSLWNLQWHLGYNSQVGYIINTSQRWPLWMANYKAGIK